MSDIETPAGDAKLETFDKDANEVAGVVGCLMGWKGYLIYLFVFLFLVISLQVAFANATILLFGHQTLGTVVGYTTSTAGASGYIDLGPGPTSTYIMVSYTDTEQHVHQLRSTTASDPPLFLLGEKVPIAYPDGNPANGRIRSWREFAVSLLLFVIACILIFLLCIIRFVFKLLDRILRHASETGKL